MGKPMWFERTFTAIMIRLRLQLLNVGIYHFLVYTIRKPWPVSNNRLTISSIDCEYRCSTRKRFYFSFSFFSPLSTNYQHGRILHTYVASWKIYVEYKLVTSLFLSLSPFLDNYPWFPSKRNDMIHNGENGAASEFMRIEPGTRTESRIIQGGLLNRVEIIEAPCRPIFHSHFLRLVASEF